MIRIAFIVSAAFAIGACNRGPEPFGMSRTKSATGTVQAVSQSDRKLVVLTSEGKRLLIEAPSDVTNFDQIRQGDEILLTYYEGLVADVVRGGQEGHDVRKTLTQGRTPPGEVPARAIGRTIATTVHIDAVDPQSDTVTFTRPDGIRRTLTVENPEAMKFAERLTPGDKVRITYREAAAVSIQPTRR